MIGDLATSGSAPALERTLQFAAARQRLLVHSIANMDTPGFRMMDADPVAFQRVLREAIEQRRAGAGAGDTGDLALKDSAEVDFSPSGLTLIPRTAGRGVLAHDRNNRDVESLMRDLGENSMVYRTTVELLRRHNDTLRTAISQRV
jgi:flagellar basal-body rod protein FlgB